MRVVFIDQSSQMGGVEYTTLRVAQNLDRVRFEPIIICPEEGTLPDLARESGIQVVIALIPKFPSVSIQIKNKYIVNPFGFLATSVNILRAAHVIGRVIPTLDPDVIITKGLLAHFYGGIAAKRRDIPCIWYVQEEVDSNRNGGLYVRLLNYFAKVLSKRVVVDANALLRQFSKYSTEKKAPIVIYNGIDTYLFSPISVDEKLKARRKLNLPENKLIIGQVGRVVPIKGQLILLQAYYQIYLEHPDTHLLIVGTPLFNSTAYEQMLKKEVEKYGLSNRVTFTGFLPDVRDGLSAMDIYVQPSLETDSPVSVQEAMSSGLPVIVSDVPGIKEFVEPEIDAFVVPAGDSKGLAKRLTSLINSKDLKLRMGEQARQAIIDKFSLANSVKKVEELLIKIYDE